MSKRNKSFYISIVMLLISFFLFLKVEKTEKEYELNKINFKVKKQSAKIEKLNKKIAKYKDENQYEVEEYELWKSQNEILEN